MICNVSGITEKSLPVYEDLLNLIFVIFDLKRVAIHSIILYYTLRYSICFIKSKNKPCGVVNAAEPRPFMWTPWRNGSASDSRSEGCVFKSRRGQNRQLFTVLF